ncbi:PREDICTED: rho GTPase-activating protein 27-like [Ceratotherium simum simum]|uniref:Rho GTPase-activating protein 27-like n=1 Tax=Ceratotherium simum simum TaxID=73337 RepID=A0ABM1CZ97_CERSS|nr:PREDICTED: rho GTPase-activating protein 27-like [Ceratotherium simum simum]
MAADVEGDVYVLVEHPFEYTGKDGRRVAIQPNERYRLLRRSTEHWWHVRREPGGRPFYLPAQYVRELPAIGDPAAAPPPAPDSGPAAPEPLAYDYRFVSASTPAGPDSAPAEPRGRVSSLCGPERRGAATQRSSLATGLPACLAGSFKACSVAGSWVCPRPLARSDSENVYEAIQDVRGPPREERPEQAVRQDWLESHSVSFPPGLRRLRSAFSRGSRPLVARAENSIRLVGTGTRTWRSGAAGGALPGLSTFSVLVMVGVPVCALCSSLLEAGN